MATTDVASNPAGAPAPPEAAAPAPICVVCEGDKTREATFDEAAAALARPSATVWFHCTGRLPELDALLTGPLHLHPVTLEDIWVDRTQPKVEEFPGYIYIVAHSAKAILPPPAEAPSEVPRANGAKKPPKPVPKLQRREVDLVFGRNWVFTHTDSTQVSAVREEILRGTRHLQRGPAFIAHAILDRLADQLVSAMDQLDDSIENVEGAAVKLRPSRTTLTRILALRRQLHGLRRSFIHQREMLLRLSRGEFELVPDEALPFFRDVHDHFLRLSDLVDDQRDALSSALEAHLSMMSNRMNEIVKVLTLISTVMLPLTFIAGVYGMNFVHMPELKWKYGYPFALGLMAIVAISLLSWFKRRGWFD